MADAVAVVFSDSHLIKKTWKHRQIFGDSYHAFRQITQFAIDNELPLIGAGDLLDKRVNEPDPIVFLQRQLKELAHREIPFYFIQGQHEFDDTPWLELGHTAIHLHEQVLTLGDLEIHGLDYQGADKLKEKLDNLPDSADVLVAHQVWSDFMGDIALPQGAFADVPHVGTLITGDLHKCIFKKFEGKGGQDLRVFSPGAGCQMNISEPSKHHFGVLNEDGYIDVVNLTSRKFDEFVCINNDDVEELLENVNAYLEGAAEFASDNGLPPELHTPLWRVEYSHRVSDLPRRLGKIVGERAHLFWKELPQEREESKILEQVPDLRKGEALTLETCLPQELDPKEEPEAYALAARVLDAEDPELEANRWLKEQME
jgi:hypothetical protein